MQAFVGELRATSRTSVAVATPPIPAPATTAPGASSHQRRRLSACGARGAVIAIGLAAVLAVALIALTPNSAAPIRDIRALALELPAPRSARRSQRPEARGPPLCSPTPGARHAQAPLPGAYPAGGARPGHPTPGVHNGAGCQFARGRAPVAGGTPAHVGAGHCCAVLGLGVPALTQRSPASHVPSHVNPPHAPVARRRCRPGRSG